MLTISVIIPVYNAGHFLEKAVQSAVSLPEVTEVILIEDGSPDDSYEVCKGIESREKKVKVLQHPEKGNHGAGASRNLGLEKVSGDYIAFLDADDYYLPNRFDAEVEYYERSGDFEGMFGALGLEFYDEKGMEYWLRFKGLSNSKYSKDDLLTTLEGNIVGRQIFEYLISFKHFKAKGYFHLNTLTINRRKWDKYPVYFPQALRLHQDIAFMIKISYFFNLRSGSVDKTIAVRGVHADNRHTTNRKQLETTFLKWKVLFEWSHQQKIEKDYQDYLKALMLKYKIITSPWSRRFSQFTNGILTNRFFAWNFRMLGPSILSLLGIYSLDFIRSLKRRINQ